VNDHELIGTTNRAPNLMDPRCTWGDDAWHRAANRLLGHHRAYFIQLLAEERAKTRAGEQP
jgi:hypothetical protein